MRTQLVGRIFNLARFPVPTLHLPKFLVPLEVCVCVCVMEWHFLQIQNIIMIMGNQILCAVPFVGGGALETEPGIDSTRIFCAVLMRGEGMEHFVESNFLKFCTIVEKCHNAIP